MRTNNLNVEYYSNVILITFDTFTEVARVIFIDTKQPKIKEYNTWFDPITINDIENDIREMLDNTSYNIEDEIDNFRHSRLYIDLLQNEEEEF